ncbi:MAG: protein-methionine-sulfoxide reductase catalytic subunit MsrP [Anaerolineales bacterium]|nr:protein-methionine-sulfoxide reductase catalytic subunit MsrP [Anaerolineales bacterium]
MRNAYSSSTTPKSSGITPEAVYYNRRSFMKSAGAIAMGAFLAACNPGYETDIESTSTLSASLVDELGAPANSYEEITSFNNFYEFTLSKTEVADLAKDFKTSPWEVEVSGLVQKPGVYTIDDLTQKYPLEERVYRLRCVEAWSMVIPWTGFELASLLKDVKPLTDAKYVRFETLHDLTQMPGLRDTSYPWPYTEGLRLDEALHPLTLLVTGIYGKALPPQDGAPIRLVVPWKYGFKSIKSIIKIELVEKQPQTFWNTIAPDEYGFYANVNPDVSHPRWSQAQERRIGENTRQKTLVFNGYAEDVAALYSDMDLSENF